VIGCFQELLAAQDGPNWSMPVTKKAYQQLLILSANASPKVKDLKRFLEDWILKRYLYNRPVRELKMLFVTFYLDLLLLLLFIQLLK
jgi:hypothetical protein